MYQPYRGARARRRRMIRNILITVLCLFIVLCLAFLLFFQNKDSVQFLGMTITFPWGHTDGGGPQQGEQDMNFEILDGENGNATEDGEPAPPAPAAETPQLLELPAGKETDAAYGAAVVSALTRQGMTGAAITVKDAEGALLPADEALSAQLAALHAQNLTASAIVYAYPDNAYAKQTAAAALQNVDHKAWRMPDGARWLDPASEEAMGYLTSVVQRCKDAGFDEVILRGFGYPTEGNVARIVYGDAYKTGAQRADLLAQRLTALREAAAPMKLSVVLDDATVQGGLNERSGQDVAKLYAAADRAYVPMSVQTDTSGDSIRQIVGALTGGDTAKLVPMYTSASLLPTLLAADSPVYFIPSETNGDLTALLS